MRGSSRTIGGRSKGMAEGDEPEVVITRKVALTPKGRPARETARNSCTNGSSAAKSCSSTSCRFETPWRGKEGQSAHDEHDGRHTSDAAPAGDEGARVQASLGS